MKNNDISYMQTKKYKVEISKVYLLYTIIIGNMQKTLLQLTSYCINNKRINI